MAPLRGVHATPLHRFPDAEPMFLSPTARSESRSRRGEAHL